jgi:hypothetical protein
MLHFSYEEGMRGKNVVQRRLFLDDKLFDAYVTCEGIHFFVG